MTYMYGGEETCPTTGRKHVQGFFCFENPRSVKAVIKLLSPTHIEQMRGSLTQNKMYCSKEGIVFIELGDRPSGQGTRTDLQDYVDKIQSGATLEDLVKTEPVMVFKFNRQTEQMLRYRLDALKRNWPMKVIIHWGSTGTGKTRAIFDAHPVDDIYMKGNHKWWDAYKGEPVVVLDEFDPVEWKRSGFDIFFVLQLLDRYPMRVEVKGSTVNFCSKIVYMTSNTNPKYWFRDCTFAQQKAFMRRVTEIKLFANVSENDEDVDI